MGLFDVPTASGGSLFGPDLERAAALQGLFAMGNAVGAASQPSPTPGVNPFAAAGQAGPKASSDFLTNALKMGLLGEQIGAARQKTAAQQQAMKLLQSGTLDNSPQTRAILAAAGWDPDKVLELRKFGYNGTTIDPNFVQSEAGLAGAKELAAVPGKSIASALATRVTPSASGAIYGSGLGFPETIEGVLDYIKNPGVIFGGAGAPAPRGDAGGDMLGAVDMTRANVPGMGSVPIMPTADARPQGSLRQLVPPSVPPGQAYGVQTAPEGQFGKDRGGAFGDVYKGVVKRTMEIPGERSRLGRLDTLLEQAYTGTGAQQVLAAQRVAKALGLDIGDPGPGEAANALSREMALMLRNPSNGAGMPGAMSDADREFLTSMVPGLTTSPDGRKLMLETRRKLLDREDAVNKLAMDYVRKHKGRQLDEDFFLEVLPKWAEKNPLFSEKDRARAAKAGEQPSRQSSAPLPPPKVGDIEAGHEFLGGDPADPSAWRKVKK